MSEVHTLSVPFILLVSAFVASLVSLSAWILSLERRKVEKEDFDRYSSRVESRMTALHAEMMQELRDLRAALRHVDECPYLKTLGQKAE